MDSSGEEYSAGSLVMILGLQAKPSLNGQFGVVKKFHTDKGRYEITPSRGSGTLAIKPSNLSQESVVKPKDAGFQERKHQIAAFWPTKFGNDIPIQGFVDWPTDWEEEKQYLKEKFQWTKPTLLSGIENAGSAKPEFQMYFDAGDKESPHNAVAQAIMNLLPIYELGKIGDAANSTLRGVCVLVYSPMKSTITNFGTAAIGMGDQPGVSELTSGNASRKFSLEQLRAVLEFHQTSAAKAQYDAHDNPMHRMFGDMM